MLQEMPKKSCDLDPIPTPILHDCLEEITPIVTDIVNKSLSSGVVPQCFKHALVKPLLKKANLDPNCPSNYRPVSNQPFLSKVMERIVLKQFSQHLESHSLLEPFQSAYRKCHSTETALLRVVNDLLRASDSGHVSVLSLFDLSAAFDTIDHDILIKRLHTIFGCSGTVLDWFTSYLSFRTQSVFGGHASTPSALKCGVPQGSVLGPLLFTLYTQSLSTVISQSGHSYHFFADDSQLHNSSTPSDFPVLVHSLKDCIEDVTEWMCDSMLKMNHNKTELIAIGAKPKISQVTLSLTPVSISGHTMPFCQSDRNLGVFIDETLSMDGHIKHLCCILFCQLRRLGKIRPFLSTDAAMRVILGTTKDTPIETMRYLLDLLSMETRHKVEQVKAHLNAMQAPKNPLHDAVKEEKGCRLARGKSWMGQAEQSIQHVCSLTELKQVRDWEKRPVEFKPYYKTLLSENLGTHCREWPGGKTNAEAQMLIEANSKPHDIVIYTDGLVTRDRSGWGFTVKHCGRTVHEVSGAHRVTTSSLTMEVEAVTHAIQWLASQRDVRITYAVILTDSMNLLQKVESGMGCPDWHTAMHSLRLQRLLWIYCPGHAGVSGNERAERLASTADIPSGLQLGRAEVLRGLRNFLSRDKPEHHSTDRLKERGVKKGSCRHSTLQGRQRSVFNQENIGTVSRATLERLLRDGPERVWAFPSATVPS